MHRRKSYWWQATVQLRDAHIKNVNLIEPLLFFLEAAKCIVTDLSFFQQLPKPVRDTYLCPSPAAV